MKDLSVSRPLGGRRVEPEMLEAFERELTTDVARRLLELAMRRTAMLRAAGAPLANEEAKVLVRDAIQQTLTQVEYWQPGEDPLSLHLRGVVERRSWARLAQVRRRLAMQAALAEADAAAELELEQRAPLGGAARQVMQQVLAGLGTDSADDAAVRLLLEAYCAGARTRAEVLAHTHLPEHEYAAARRRLDRVLAALPGAPTPAPTAAPTAARSLS